MTISEGVLDFSENVLNKDYMLSLFKSCTKRDVIAGSVVSFLTGTGFLLLVFFHFKQAVALSLIWGIPTIPLFVLNNYSLSLDLLLSKGNIVLFALSSMILFVSWLIYWGVFFVLQISFLRNRRYISFFVCTCVLVVISCICKYFVSTYLFWQLSGGRQYGIDIGLGWGVL
jgi:hypothetical protein